MSKPMDLGFEFYKEFLERFLDLLKGTFGESLISLVLYGSVARGKAKVDSDIDLLLILDNLPDNYHRRLDQVLEVQACLKREEIYKKTRERLGIEPFLSYLILSQEEAKENRHIYLDMVEDARIVYDQGDFFSDRLKQIKQRLRELGSRRIWLEDGTWYWDLKPDLKPDEVFTL
jgi:hypothetical protein